MPSENQPYLTDETGHEHALENSLTRIGRGIENEIVIVSKLSSREHAHIRREGRRIFLEDQNSTNGTYLNGERVQGSVGLRDGDLITIGGLQFSFHDPEMTSRETPFPELDVNLAAGEVRVNRRIIQLSPKEFNLLAFLYEKRGLVCSKDDIGRAVWAEYQEGVFDYQIENLVRRLRTKIETDADTPQLLLTIRGLGYKLAAPQGALHQGQE